MQTGINAIDSAIRDLYEFGYIHNHLRMYIASITTNIAKTHWKIPQNGCIIIYLMLIGHPMP